MIGWNMKQVVRKSIERIQQATERIRYTRAGNRSMVCLDYGFLLSDPHFVRLVTEYRATGNFTGYLLGLSKEDAGIVQEIRESLSELQRMKQQQQYSAESTWKGFDDATLPNILSADPRLFNHIGALNYKTCAFHPPSMEALILEIVRLSALYGHLSSRGGSFEGLYTGLNSPFFTLDGHRLNSGLRAYEEKGVLQPLLDEIKRKKGKLTVLEIGAGDGQLANLLLREGAKYVVIDLPSMHARAPYFLYKNAKARLCTYRRYVQLNRNLEKALTDYDVVYLPPWEAGTLNHRFDLAVNVHSISEMSPAEVSSYLKIIQGACDYFFSVNTNTAGWLREAQRDEVSCLLFDKHLSMDLLETGTMFYDSALLKVPHYVYALYGTRGHPRGGNAAGETVAETSAQQAAF